MKRYEVSREKFWATFYKKSHNNKRRQSRKESDASRKKTRNKPLRKVLRGGEDKGYNCENHLQQLIAISMKRKQLWMMAMAAISLLGGCTIFESEEPIVTGGDSPSVAVSSDIAPSYFAPGGGLPALASGRMPSTRSAVDQTSVVDLTANFLRIDEDINPDTYRGYYTFSGGEFNPARPINWEEGLRRGGYPDVGTRRLRGAPQECLSGPCAVLPPEGGE
jgi:hypothetical protein